MVTVLSCLVLYYYAFKKKKIAGKNMKEIISKEIEGSSDSDIDETTND